MLHRGHLREHHRARAGAMREDEAGDEWLAAKLGVGELAAILIEQLERGQIQQLRKLAAL